MNKDKIVAKEVEIGGRSLRLETGKYAQKADASVLASYGETVVLATVVVGEEKPEVDYLPLFVEFQEKFYAGGVIKGSRWIKREGRPSDEAILTGRLIDRSIRPLFSQELRREVQVIVTTLSVDQENDPAVLGLVASSAALYLATLRGRIDWAGPVGALRVGIKNLEDQGLKEANSEDGVETSLILNPINGEREKMALDLVVAGKGEQVIMLEGKGSEVPEELVLKAIEKVLGELGRIVEMIKGLGEKAEEGRVKPSGQRGARGVGLKVAVKTKEKELREDLTERLKDLDKPLDEVLGWQREVLNELRVRYEDIKREELEKIFEEEFKKKVRKIWLSGKRLDGRKEDEVRPVTAEVGLFPRTHGSAFFTRGETHVLSIVTLAVPSLEQWIEGPEGLEKKRYMHHYEFPPYATGETGRLGWPSRREVGHGALAERALESVIPSEEDFPYTIRVVSETMSSSGSTSMGAVCGSTLALMDAGVPIIEPVAGVAVGLVTEERTKNEGQKTKDKAERDFVILTDIAYVEDTFGDMDFKLAGTKKGMTAIQMDMKIQGVDKEILNLIFEAARKGRREILTAILQVFPAPRAAVSERAPKVEVIKVSQDQIGEVIGPGGKVIRKIIGETGATIDVEDDGKVTIGAYDKNSLQKAVDWVKSLTEEPEIGEIYEGKVTRIVPFGAFVEILPGKEGLVHISEMASSFVEDPHQVVSLGQGVKVKVLELDQLGRINLTMDLEKSPGARRHQPARRIFGRYPKDEAKNRRPFSSRPRRRMPRRPGSNVRGGLRRRY